MIRRLPVQRLFYSLQAGDSEGDIVFVAADGNKRAVWEDLGNPKNDDNHDCHAEPGQPDQPDAGSKLAPVVVVAGGAAAGALVTPVAAVAAVQAVGFSSSGIVGGSWAASMMSASAIANGGGVASGSAVAVAQSIGALGALPAGMAAGAAVAGGTALGLAGYGAYRLWRWRYPATPSGKLDGDHGVDHGPASRA